MSLIARLLGIPAGTQIPKYLGTALLNQGQVRYKSQLPSDTPYPTIQRAFDQSVKVPQATPTPVAPPIAKVDPFNPPKARLIKPLVMKALNTPDEEKTEEDYEVLAKAEKLLDTVFPGSRRCQQMSKIAAEANKNKNKGT